MTKHVRISVSEWWHFISCTSQYTEVKKNAWGSHLTCISSIQILITIIVIGLTMAARTKYSRGFPWCVKLPVTVWEDGWIEWQNGVNSVSGQRGGGLPTLKLHDNNAVRCYLAKLCLLPMMKMPPRWHCQEAMRLRHMHHCRGPSLPRSSHGLDQRLQECLQKKVRTGLCYSDLFCSISIRSIPNPCTSNVYW